MGVQLGQLIQVPVGGQETGAGGSIADDGVLIAPIALGLTALVGAGALTRRMATR